jgi:hypothetical protein
MTTAKTLFRSYCRSWMVLGGFLGGLHLVRVVVATATVSHPCGPDSMEPPKSSSALPALWICPGAAPGWSVATCGTPEASTRWRPCWGSAGIGHDVPLMWWVEWADTVHSVGVAVVEPAGAWLLSRWARLARRMIAHARVVGRRAWLSLFGSTTTWSSTWRTSRRGGPTDSALRRPFPRGGRSSSR